MTLFLDRDGVINERIVGGYVLTKEQFRFLPGALEAISYLTQQFDRTVVVTNQQGIGKGLFTEKDLDLVHQHMLENIEAAGGKIDKVYYCPKLAKQNAPCRKPNVGMGEAAQKDFPDIIFEKSIMVGDSISDMNFGLRLGMQTVYITTKEEEQEASKKISVDWRLNSLATFAKLLENGKIFLT